MRASPESLSRTRLYARPALAMTLRQARLLGDLGGEVVLLLFQALAELVAGEAANLAVFADLADELVQEIADRLLVVLDPCLLEETDLLLPLGDLAIDDLADDVLRLARLARLLQADAALLLDRVGRNVLGGEVERVHGGDLQRHLAHERLERVAAGDEVCLAVHLEQHADAVVRVNVGADHALGGDAAGLLGGGGQTLLAQELARLLHVPAR